MKVSIFSAFIWLAICMPNESSSQSVVVVATPDMSQVHGFCDIVTITVLVRNLTGSSASFSGEIEFRNDFIEIVDYSELTNYNRTDVGAEASITYTIGTLSQGAYAYMHYQVKVKSYSNNTYWTENFATVTSNPSLTSSDLCFIGAKVYFPIYGQASVNEIMEETANQNILLSLFPVEPLPVLQTLTHAMMN